MPKILVADDNANIQRMVVLAFEERGIQVVTVGNGEAAVRRIPDLNPDLVLADIFMPVRNGYEVCEFVKKDERFSHVPVILLVGAFDPLDEKEARRVGADGVLKKPFIPPDPLIAMVMSALEKNPNVVAEMAKAKEAKEAKEAALAEPVAPLEIPARAEPKPLPHFPEPTPEEAAMVYGFGKGVRALDDEQSSASGGPKAPVAETEETDDAEFDGSATSSDWRRNAMDFEIPADSVNMPAFSSDENLDPSTFPSESEYPPRRVRVFSAAEEAASIAQNQVPAPAVTESAAVSESVAPESFSSSVVLPEPSVSAEAQADVQPQSEVQGAPAAESESKSEAPSSEVAAHWMDALAPSKSEYPGGGWMSSLSDEPAKSSATEFDTNEPVESREQSSSLEFFAAQEEIRASASENARGEVFEDINSALVLPEPQAMLPPAPQVQEESSFAEASFAEAPAVSEPAESWFAPTPSVFDNIQDPVSSPVAVAASEPDQALELDPVDPEPAVAMRDPALVESPAVRVTPEPLLVDSEESHGPSEYGSRPQEVPPLHSFFEPPSGSSVNEGSAGMDFSGHHTAPVSSFEAPSDDWNGRFPTAAPPNREALSDIPFLTPPPDFRANARDAAQNAETVDEVVRKVLEKLEPRLHDLLSQGLLKPLVENILQGELSKKER